MLKLAIDYLVSMWALATKGDLQGIFFFASLYALLVLTYSAFYQLNILKWPSTKGHLLQERMAKFGPTELITSNQDYKLAATYQYKVGREPYTGSRVSPWVMVASHNARFLLQKQLDGITRAQDGSVTVYFNPKNPKRSFLIKPGKTGLAITVSLAVVPMLLYWVKYHG